MPFKKGQSGNASGRPKDSPNKVTSETKEKFQELVNAYDLDQMKKDLMSLEPAERLKIISGLLNYFIPKQNYNINEQVDPIEIKGITFDK